MKLHDDLRRITAPEPDDGPCVQAIKEILSGALPLAEVVEFPVQVVDLPTDMDQRLRDCSDAGVDGVEPPAQVVARPSRKIDAADLPTHRDRARSQLLANLIFRAHKRTLSRLLARVKRGRS